MLSQTQLEHAVNGAHRTDKVCDAAAETYTEIHHHDNGVYVVTRDSASDEVIDSECCYISYKTLCAINARQWPYKAGMTNGQMAIGIYGPESVLVFRHPGVQCTNNIGNAVVKRDDPPVDVFEDFFFGGK